MSGPPSALPEASESVDPVIEAYKRDVDPHAPCARISARACRSASHYLIALRLAAEARDAGARITRPR